MNKIKYLLLIAMCLCLSSVAAQDRISGHVWNRTDGPVMMANVVELDQTACAVDEGEARLLVGLPLIQRDAVGPHQGQSRLDALRRADHLKTPLLIAAHDRIVVDELANRVDGTPA